MTRGTVRKVSARPLFGLRLGLLPERFHLVERGIGRRPAVFGKSGLYPFEATHDFGVRHSERGLGVDLQVPRQIGDDEEQVADLALDLGMAGALRPRLDDLTASSAILSSTRSGESQSKPTLAMRF